MIQNHILIAASGTIDVAEDDTDALFEVSKMLQVSEQITRFNILEKSVQTDLAERLTGNAETEEVLEDYGSVGQKLSGKAKTKTA